MKPSPRGGRGRQLTLVAMIAKIPAVAGTVVRPGCVIDRWLLLLELKDLLSTRD